MNLVYMHPMALLSQRLLKVAGVQTLVPASINIMGRCSACSGIVTPSCMAIRREGRGMTGPVSGAVIFLLYLKY